MEGTKEVQRKISEIAHAVQIDSAYDFCDDICFNMGVPKAVPALNKAQFLHPKGENVRIIVSRARCQDHPRSALFLK